MIFVTTMLKFKYDLSSIKCQKYIFTIEIWALYGRMASLCFKEKKYGSLMYDVEGSSSSFWLVMFDKSLVVNGYVI